MKTDKLQNVKRNENGKITIVFTIAYNSTLNNPSTTPNAAWAAIKNHENIVVILKECRSTSEFYAKQDIGFTLHSPRFPEHYNVSNEQYNELFGEEQWEKKWMNLDEFQLWKGNGNLIMDSDANSLQEKSWRSTGHC